MIRIFLSICLVVGMAYAATTMAAELIWKNAHEIVERAAQVAIDNPDATKIIITALAQGGEGAKLAARLAPEIHWIRSAPSLLAIENPMMPDEEAIDLLREELRSDPYDTRLTVFLALRLKHAGRQDEAMEVYKRAEHIWPDSPMTFWLNYNLTHQSQPEALPPPLP